ncbi:MAG: ThiF family adenylyltransferase [Brumimicrobium sp.]|nr:ThiF family adenylyltransferase [Brumimicrobium sp.]
MSIYTLKPYVDIRENELYYVLSGGEKSIVLDKKQAFRMMTLIIDKKSFECNTPYESEALEELNISGYICKHEDANESGDRLSYFFESLGINFQKEEVQKSKILVLGAGGGGGTIVYLLAQIGIYNIKCIDFDKVEISDIEKTFVYRNNNIGEFKTIALKKIINENFFNVNFSYENRHLSNDSNLEKIIIEYKPDIIINAIDPKPSHKMWLNRLCFKLKLPVFFMAYSYETIILGPFLSYRTNVCYNSYNRHVKNTSHNVIDFEKIEPLKIQGNIHPSTSFNINILGAFSLKEILLYLSGNTEKMLSHNKILFLNSMTMEANQLELLCDADCECSEYL